MWPWPGGVVLPGGSQRPENWLVPWLPPKQGNGTSDDAHLLPLFAGGAGTVIPCVPMFGLSLNNNISRHHSAECSGCGGRQVESSENAWGGSPVEVCARHAHMGPAAGGGFDGFSGQGPEQPGSPNSDWLAHRVAQDVFAILHIGVNPDAEASPDAAEGETLPGSCQGAPTIFGQLVPGHLKLLLISGVGEQGFPEKKTKP